MSDHPSLVKTLAATREITRYRKRLTDRAANYHRGRVPLPFEQTDVIFLVQAGEALVDRIAALEVVLEDKNRRLKRARKTISTIGDSSAETRRRLAVWEQECNRRIPWMRAVVDAALYAPGDDA